LMGSGGSRGLQNRWLLKFAMAGSIPASSVFVAFFIFSQNIRHFLEFYNS